MSTYLGVECTHNMAGEECGNWFHPGIVTRWQCEEPCCWSDLQVAQSIKVALLSHVLPVRVFLGHPPKYWEECECHYRHLALIGDQSQSNHSQLVKPCVKCSESGERHTYTQLDMTRLLHVLVTSQWEITLMCNCRLWVAAWSICALAFRKHVSDVCNITPKGVSENIRACNSKIACLRLRNLCLTSYDEI